MQRELKKFQPDPIQIERLIQGRASDPDGASPEAYPQDTTLEAAVASMTAAAKKAGFPSLVLPVEEWRRLVLLHLDDTDPGGFFQEIVGRLPSAPNLDDLNLWLALANNIWNTTPQPDRGGRTALELSAPFRTQHRDRRY
jgi:hypothetical protein